MTDSARRAADIARRAAGAGEPRRPLPSRWAGLTLWLIVPWAAWIEKHRRHRPAS